MKFKKIRIKMLLTILPITIIAMILMTVISSISSKNTINSQIAERMQAELSAKEGEMGEHLDSVSNMATAISRVVETTYKTTDMDTYMTMLGNIIEDNDIVLGSGLWFEPYAYDANELYMGPYIYKDGSELVITYDYSNADYDYFVQEYYLNAKNSQKAIFTDPYYDETSNMVMSSCSMPIYDNGVFIGCVTVDIELTTITELVDAISVGEAGKAILTTGDGTYLAGVDSAKVSAALKITEDSNTSFAEAGGQMLQNENGEFDFVDGEEMKLYTSTLDETGWKLAITMPVSEIESPVHKLANQLVVVCVVAVILVGIIIALEVNAIAVNLMGVNSFAGALAAGDFTIQPIRVKSEDELGTMGKSLNLMYDSNKKVISDIKIKAEEIDDSSDKLRNAAFNLAEKFEEIQRYMGEVNQAMLTTSAATEELNASSEEVLSNVHMLTGETASSKQMATEIKGRATEVGNTSREAYDSAIKLTTDFEEKLRISMENARVVESIGEMADVISNIAGQINLLSLNASIEAARAGDAGRGFAVVATEIGTLATSTTDAVKKIQGTIADVQVAFDTLSSDSKAVIDFLRDKVSPDYNKFVDVAERYGEDADSIAEMSIRISEMSDTIRSIMQEVSDAVQSIAEATQNTTELSGNILGSIENVSVNVDEISNMSEANDAVAGELNEVVNKFKL